MIFSLNRSSDTWEKNQSMHAKVYAKSEWADFLNFLSKTCWMFHFAIKKLFRFGKIESVFDYIDCRFSFNMTASLTESSLETYLKALPQKN